MSDSLVRPTAVVAESATIGANNCIDAQAVIGGEPLHTAYDGSETWVTTGDNVVTGGLAGAYHFIPIGRFCMVAAHIALRKDALPYSLIGGHPVHHYRLNSVGLLRNGVTGDRYRALETPFRALRDGDRALDGVPETEEVRYLREWLRVKSKYGRYGFLRRGG